MQHEKVIIIGSGPAGLTAALYTARANLNPVVIAGQQLGGQIAITSEVENYPGFPDGLVGPDMVELFRKQAERFGARLVHDIVTEVDFSSRPFYIKTYGEEYQADSVVLAIGATPRHLEVPGETTFTGRGVSYCGTCDGFFFKDKEIVVVGGGDSAIEEGIFLTKFASKVEIIHRRDELRAKPILQQRAFKNDKMSFVWDTVVDAILGEETGTVNAVRLRNVKTGETWEHPAEGIFIFVGHYPNSDLVKGQLELDEAGYVVVDDHQMTSMPGVFAAGEIADPLYRQVATSVGQGAAAGMMLERWLGEVEAEEEAAAEGQPA
jgi:thioredoxin reductase (NADPH)